jgi:hypothetical protein
VSGLSGPVDWFEVFGTRFGLALDPPAARVLFGRLYAPHRVADGPGPVFGLSRGQGPCKATWQIRRDGSTLETRDRLADALQALEYAVCSEVVQGRGRRLVLHGATVYGADGCAFISGLSEAGKTTLALALATRGYPAGGDDAAFLDPDTGVLLPVPRCAHLDERSSRLLRRAGLRISDPLARRYRFITPADLGGPVSPVPLRSIVLLGPGFGTTPELSPVSQAEAALALLREAGWENEQTPAALAALVRLAGGASCYRLARGRLRLVAGTVAALLGPPPVPPR